jgi:hypothetical protein
MFAMCITLCGKLKNSEKVSDIYVLDGGFRLHQDIKYADGVSFTVVSYDNERRACFLEDDFDADLSCKSSHGLNVTGVIAVGVNNALGLRQCRTPIPFLLTSTSSFYTIN